MNRRCFIAQGGVALAGATLPSVAPAWAQTAPDVKLEIAPLALEIAPGKELYNNPKHPYTEALLSAVPIPDPSIKRKRIILEGDVPSPIKPPSGCRFHTRCSIRVPSCSENEQVLKEVSPNHWVACQVRS